MALILGSTVCLSVVAECEYRPHYRRMSAPGLTSEAQLRYILQWFGEFSELQREDFLPVLAAARGDKPDQLAASLATIACHDKPVSLFQCRIKLFNEWFPTWAEEEQDRVIKGVTEIDPDFGTKLQDLLTNGPQLNGDQNGTDELHSPVPEEESKTEESETWNGGNGEAAEESTEQVVQDNIPVEIAAAS
ncbi:uncharacterized protein C14orf119 isoform X1 [Trichoplusia ni]|uniref:Uncharacterized protein C14orf119 isoform X1 n=2 Tax=Trichoplusia ni TaxID=7111 RepID=A0A7E5W3N0_TRINI|nr:uncharacterized protein C14orf119 isoform X1 [Trichoplusia ni]